MKSVHPRPLHLAARSLVFAAFALVLLVSLGGVGWAQPPDNETPPPDDVREAMLAAARPKPLGPVTVEELAVIPLPTTVTLNRGSFNVVDGQRLQLPTNASRAVWLAAQAIVDDAQAWQGVAMKLDIASIHPIREPYIRMMLVPEEGRLKFNLPAEGYRMMILPEAIGIEGNSEAGLVNGLHTLRQMIRHHGTQLRCMTIEDAPSMARRIYHLDVSRGKVPTVAGLKQVIDHLWLFRMNELQLYVEHSFDFRFDPAIGEGLEPLTPAEIFEIHHYCAERGIAFVPSIQSFGHMGRILSMPAYRALAEIEATKEWKDLSWAERIRGLTIDVRNPKSRGLVEQMWDNYLPLFTSGEVNAGADETYDLGKGKNLAAAVDEKAVGQLYLEHIVFLNELAHNYGKRLAIWGDAFRNHPELFAQLPQNVVILNWGYGGEGNFVPVAKGAREAGLPLVECAGTTTWNRFLPSLTNADKNIRNHAAVAREFGAEGLMVTDWGDDGHINTYSLGYHGLALTAEAAWSGEAARSSDDFDAVWGLAVLGDPSGKLIKQLRELILPAERQSAWRTFYRVTFTGQEPGAPVADWEKKVRDAFTSEQFVEMRDGAIATESAFEAACTRPSLDPLVVAEWRQAVRLHGWYAEKVLLTRAIVEAGEAGVPAELRPRLAAFAQAMRTESAELERLWLARAKRSGLDEVLMVFETVAAEAETLAVGSPSPTAE